MNAKRTFKFRGYALVASIFIFALVLSACGPTESAAIDAYKAGEINTWELQGTLAALRLEADGTVATAEAALEPTAQGMTDCAEAEKATTGVGTVADPLIYPDGYAHDLCWSSAGNGTGAKYIRVRGPAALQMGEFTGPVRMVYVPSGTTFTGWTQGGWAYISNDALLAQWKIESLDVGRFGLICGYSRNLKLTVPAFEWDGSKEVRNEDLDCPYTVTQLLDGDYGAVSATPVPGATMAPAVTGFGYEAYPEIFKVEVAGEYYCGARANSATYPTGTRQIETRPKSAGDGDYLLDGGSSGMSPTTGFCKGNSPGGGPWTTVLLENDGYNPVNFPLDP